MREGFNSDDYGSLFYSKVMGDVHQWGNWHIQQVCYQLYYCYYECLGSRLGTHAMSPSRTDPAVRASLSDHVVDSGAVVLNIQPFSFHKALCLGLAVLLRTIHYVCG